MTHPGTNESSELRICEVCATEVPLDEALIPEAVDYVVYLCALDCYARWQTAWLATDPWQARGQDARGDKPR